MTDSRFQGLVPANQANSMSTILPEHIHCHFRDLDLRVQIAVLQVWHASNYSQQTVLELGATQDVTVILVSIPRS